MKKMTSILLALAMIFALAVTAFAGEQQQNADTDTRKTVKADGEAVAPTVTVTMPTGVVLGLNPYKMKYAGTTAFLKNEKGKQDQILSPIAIIENKSDVKLSVTAVVTAAPSDNVTLVATDDAVTVASGDQPKNVHLEMQLGKVDSKTATTFSGDTEPTKATFDATSKKVEYKVIETETASAKKPLEVDPTDGKTANYFGFKFSGKAAEAPTTPWDKSDKIDVSVVFTFNPVVLDVQQQQQQQGA